MSSVDRYAEHIRDLLMHDRPIGSSAIQNVNPGLVTSTASVLVLAAPDPGYRYELMQLLVINELDGASSQIVFTDGSASPEQIRWQTAVGDPSLGSGQSVHTFAPRRRWGNGKGVWARLRTGTGSVRVFVSAIRVRINPQDVDGDAALPTTEA